MHTARLAMPSVVLLLCMSFAVSAAEPPTEPKTSLTSAETAPDAEKKAELKPPPGFRARKRGDEVVYCRKETELGSRFAKEKCYDKAQFEELQRLELEQAEALERMRACAIGSCST